MVSRSRFETIAAADAWVCWLCGDPVPETATQGPWSGTVDHVVPKVRGGRTDDDNLRLAHRRCNTRRSSADPVIEWPAGVYLMDSPPLFAAAVRLAERGGDEIVGVGDRASAVQGAEWLKGKLEQMLRGEWSVEVEDRGSLAVVVARCVVAPRVIPSTRRRSR